MPLMQLIYASRPFGYEESVLDAILLSARHHNDRNGVTGALICRHDVFVQLLEGPADAVRSTFARIERDDRHIEVTSLWSGEVEGRKFGDWAMRHDPYRSWMWSPDEIHRGVHLDAGETAVRAVFDRISDEQPAVRGCPVRHG